MATPGLKAEGMTVAMLADSHVARCAAETPSAAAAVSTAVVNPTAADSTVVADFTAEGATVADAAKGQFF
jgi:hypothetical protein